MAYSLDPALQDHRPEMTIDASVYRTALDLSKPLPPRWSICQLQQPVPAAAAACWPSRCSPLAWLGLPSSRPTTRNHVIVSHSSR